MNRPRNPVLRWLLDVLLIPVAVLLILLEDVLWAGALAVLRALRRHTLVQAAQARLAALPAWVVLPMFVVPEALSHVAGFYVTILLAQGHVAAAMTMIAGKLVCKLMLVWIYTTCQDTLMGVAWFARFHHWTSAWLAWARERIGPVKERLRAAFARLRWRSSTAGLRLRSRLSAARVWVVRRLRAKIRE
jgi:hypothetical protein